MVVLGVFLIWWISGIIFNIHIIRKTHDITLSETFVIVLIGLFGPLIPLAGMKDGKVLFKKYEE